MRINCYISIGIIIGFMFNVVGSIIMAVCLLISIGTLESIFDKYFFPLYNIIYIRISGCIMAITVIVFSILIVIFSRYSNKYTKDSVYRGDVFCIGGKNSATVLLVVNNIAVIIWIIIASLLCVPSLVWVMLKSTCFHELISGMNFNYIFNLTSFGIYQRLYLYDISLNYREAITRKPDFESFCDENSKSGPLFLAALGGALSVIFGLALFNSYLSASYSRLKFTSEIAEYRKIVDMQNELALSN